MKFRTLLLLLITAFIAFGVNQVEAKVFTSEKQIICQIDIADDVIIKSVEKTNEIGLNIDKSKKTNNFLDFSVHNSKNNNEYYTTGVGAYEVLKAFKTGPIDDLLKQNNSKYVQNSGVPTIFHSYSENEDYPVNKVVNLKVKILDDKNNETCSLSGIRFINI